LAEVIVKDLAIQQTHHQAGLTDPVFGGPCFLRDLATVVRERPENGIRRTTLVDCANSLIGKQLVTGTWAC
jgi:hypothetical protein